MSRMTRRNGDRIELLGYDRMIDAMDDLIAKVCDYEEDEERREQGCEQCKSCANCGNYDPMCPVMSESVMCANEERTMWDSECVNFRPAGHCWNCAKKLVE